MTDPDKFKKSKLEVAVNRMETQQRTEVEANVVLSRRSLAGTSRKAPHAWFLDAIGNVKKGRESYCFMCPCGHKRY